MLIWTIPTYSQLPCLHLLPRDAAFALFLFHCLATSAITLLTCNSSSGLDLPTRILVDHCVFLAPRLMDPTLSLLSPNAA